MSKATIEKLIPKAIAALQEVFGNDEIKSVYQGYLSSFGVGIVQVGLLPTLAYFESEKNNEENNKKGDRKIISDLVLSTLGYNEVSLLHYAVSHNHEKEKLTNEIKDASVALKLSMNLFDLGNEKGGV